jgi:hypothetical protein
MCDKCRHGIDESCRHGVDRVQSDHAGIDGSVDFRDGGRVELISKFSGVDLIFFDFAFWHPESRRRMHQRERCIYGTGISSFIFRFSRLRQNNKSPGRKEESIALSILLPAVGIILRWVEVRPHTHRVDVLVLLVPPTIHDFDQTRVAVEAFQLGVWDLSGVVPKLICG